MKKITLIISALIMSFGAFAATSDWCDVKIGHMGNPDFGDAQSHMLLTVTKGAAANTVDVTLKPAADNPKKISYMWVNCTSGNAVSTPVEAGAGDGSEENESLTVTMEFNAGTTDAKIEIQYAHSGWNGRWCMGNGSACAPIDIDITAECGGACELTENPTMVSAELVSTATTSAIISVAGKDQKGGDIVKFVVSGEGFSEKIFTATDGKIEVDGLAAGKSYTLTVKAKDECGNISDAGISVELETVKLEVECEGQRGNFAIAGDKKINFSIAYNENNGETTFTISPIDAERTIREEGAAIVNLNGAGYNMVVASDGKSASYTTNSTAESFAIAFVYGFDNMAGNEQTALKYDLSDPNIIYYELGACGATAANEAQTAQLSVYPNPTSSYVNIASADIMTKVQVRNVVGSVVAEVYPNDTVYNLDVKALNLATGRYFVTIFNGKSFETQTIIVK